MYFSITQQWLTLTLVLRSYAIFSGYKNDCQQTIGEEDFVKVDGLRLKDGKGIYYLTGINYWACMNLAADGSQGGDPYRFITELDQMASKGINHLRIMAASEGAATMQPFRMNPPLMTKPGEYNEAVFIGLDRCLAEMGKRGMRATMTLNNEWQWSGGFSQYVSWATNNSQIPYPSSWNLTAPPQRNKPRTGWGNYTTEGTDAAPYNTFTNFANEFYTNIQAQNWYQDHIERVINRRNTITGRMYKDDPTIMTWQLANEPQVQVTSSQGQGPYSLESPSNPTDPLLDWINKTSAFIRTQAPRQLISVGFESKQGEWYFKTVHNHSTIDYATSHCWVQNWGIYDMYNSSSTNLEKAITFARHFITNTSRWATEINKPIFLEEFGMARDNWQNQNDHTTVTYPYLSSATTTHKDAYFEAVISMVMSSFMNEKEDHDDGNSKGAAYLGTSPWAYGGIYRPETQEINGFGMVWAGDPPHEAPGWYDLYDTDEAMNIILRQKLKIDRWLTRQMKTKLLDIT